MRLLPPLAALIFGVAYTPLFAGSAEDLPLSYSIFEAAVPHIDLVTCPVALAGDDVFCRATLAHEEVHVFAFRATGDSHLAGFASYEATELPKLLN